MRGKDGLLVPRGEGEAIRVGIRFFLGVCLKPDPGTANSACTVRSGLRSKGATVPAPPFWWLGARREHLTSLSFSFSSVKWEQSGALIHKIVFRIR